MSATDLVAAFRAKALSPVEVLQVLMERIEAVDRAGPAINSILRLSEDALGEAKKAESAYLKQADFGKLLGVPILLKDNIDTEDLDTTAGSLAFRNMPRPRRDAEVTRRLRDAGAIIFGKTNLSEWSNMRGSRSSSGWSAVGGQTKNPHALDRSPGGSSSGSGAAVAAMLSPLALGSETDGSINCPASVCGVVGMKPTVGRVSRRGVIPISSTQDSVGPLTRSVADARLLLDVISGLDTEDPATIDYHNRIQPIRSQRSPRVGALARAASDFSPNHLRLYNEKLTTLRNGGFHVITEVDDSDEYELKLSSSDSMRVLISELSDTLENYLADRGAPDADSIKAIVDFNRSNSRDEMLFYGQDHFEAALKSLGISADEYRVSFESNRKLARQGIDSILDRHDLDVIVAPSMAPAWLIDQVLGDRYVPECYSYAAVAGYPSMTIPMGAIFGLPVGLLIFGTAGSEDLLLDVADQIEAHLNYSGIVSFSSSTQIH